MNNILRLQFRADTEDTGELVVSARASGFSGEGSAWFSKSALVDFARKLETTYPLQASSPLQLEGGYGGKAPGELAQVHVGLYFLPVGKLGAIRCRVKLAIPILEQYPDEPHAYMTLDLGTTYEPLRSFARALEMVVLGTLEEAVLQAAG